MGEEVVLVEAEPTPEGWKLAAPALREAGESATGGMEEVSSAGGVWSLVLAGCLDLGD
jgi:hypothetical protein